MKALILAAGMGNRLGKLTTDKPKALVQVGSALLIDRTISFVKHPKIEKIGVVGGYCFDALQKHLDREKVQMFLNPRFREGNISTIRAATDFIDDDLLILNVDHIYPKEMLTHILNTAKGISAVCDFDRRLVSDDMKVKLNTDRKLQKISKQLTDFDCGYIGMTFVSKNMSEIYKKAVNETFEIYGKDSCVEFVLGHLAANDHEINICDTTGFKWLEVDTPEDLLNAEKVLAKENV